MKIEPSKTSFSSLGKKFQISFRFHVRQAGMVTKYKKNTCILWYPFKTLCLRGSSLKLLVIFINSPMQISILICVENLLTLLFTF